LLLACPCEKVSSSTLLNLAAVLFDLAIAGAACT